jgi:hypothetical protein
VAVTLTVTSSAEIPPDPVTVAPPVDPTVATDILATTAFLYTGAPKRCVPSSTPSNATPSSISNLHPASWR